MQVPSHERMNQKMREIGDAVNKVMRDYIAENDEGGMDVLGLKAAAGKAMVLLGSVYLAEACLIDPAEITHLAQKFMNDIASKADITEDRFRRLKDEFGGPDVE